GGASLARFWFGCLRTASARTSNGVHDPTPGRLDAAARRLAALRLRDGVAPPLTRLPEAARPRDMDEAYAVQVRLRARLAPALGAPAGWKIGCTTPVMQAYLGVPHPCAGTLFAGGLHRGAVRLQAARFHRLGLECELAVTLRADLGLREGGHDADSVAASVATLHASIEVVEERFAGLAEAGAPTLTADDFFGAGCVLGEGRPLSTSGDPAALAGGFAAPDAAPAETGRGAAILGHPLTALAWLANLRAGQGQGLRAGEVVTLGSVVRTIYPQPGDILEARFDSLPPARVEIL
ncbi:MAG: hypothetical protein AAFU61_16255, partial [Pseudomonadota bacterium]